MIQPKLENYDIVLVNTPAQDYSIIGANEQTGTIPPLGLGSIATFLQKNNQSVGLLDADAYTLTPKQTVRILNNVNTRFVGLNAVSENVHIAGWIGERLPQKVILGGIHASLAPEQTIQRFPWLYALVQGEGEKPTLKLLRKISREKIEGVVFMKERNVIAYPRSPFLDLKEIPMPDRNFFLSTDEVILISSRGCPHNCAFCASPILCNRIVRFSPMDKVVTYMRDAYDQGKTRFHFMDDQFLITEKRARKFLQFLKKYGLYGNIQWRAMTRVDVLLCFSDEITRELKESGGTKLAVGIESGCDRILKMVHKKINTRMTRKMVTKIANAGFEVKAFFILGFPTETYKEMCQTRRFIMELGEIGLSYFNIAIFRPYPGTEIYGMLLDQGYSPDKIFFCDAKSLKVFPDAHYIHGFQNQLNREVQVSEVPIDILREFIADTINEFKERFSS